MIVRWQAVRFAGIQGDRGKHGVTSKMAFVFAARLALLPIVLHLQIEDGNGLDDSKDE